MGSSSMSYLYMAGTGIVGSVMVALGYYLSFVPQKPKIYAGNKRLREFLERRIPTLNETYWPIMYWEGTMQTVLSMSRRVTPQKQLPYTREIFELKDGGVVGLDYMEPEIQAEKKMVVFLMPGLTSSSQTSYVRTLVLAITKAGGSVCVLNNRGLGGVPLKTPRLYSASNYDDMREVIHHLKKKFEADKLIVIGTSLGGMVLCKYLLTEAEEAKKNISTALVISICWDAVNGTINLENSFLNKHVINYGLTANLLRLAKKFGPVLEKLDVWDLKKVMKSKTIREFDTNFTAPFFGFPTVDDYYRSATVVGQVYKFPIPIFGFGACDDPMQPNHLIPYDEVMAENSNLAMIMTKYGGHLGFLENGTKTFHYLERFVTDFLVALNNHSDEIL